jgi:hypothetical protein
MEQDTLSAAFRRFCEPGRRDLSPKFPPVKSRVLGCLSLAPTLDHFE